MLVDVLIAVLGGDALAAGIDVESFRPAVDGLRTVRVDDGLVLPEGGYGAFVLGSAALAPLVVRSDGGARFGGGLLAGERVVAGVATFRLGGHYSLGRVRLGGDVPLHVASWEAVGDGLALRPPILGDVRLSTELRLLDPANRPVALSLVVDAYLPTGEPARFLGVGRASVRSGLAASRDVGPVRLAGELAVRVPAGADLGAGLASGPVVGYGVAVSGQVHERGWLIGEIVGEHAFVAPAARPVEADVAVRARIADTLFGTVGGGVGLSRGVGAPLARAFVGLAFAPGSLP